MRRLLAIVPLAILAVLVTTTGTALAEPAPSFVLGFRAIANLIPDLVGNPVENETHNPVNGDGLQHTTTGLLVWRKADNWTAFTNGYWTWVNGPIGLQKRLNTERFPWEADDRASSDQQPQVSPTPQPRVEPSSRGEVLSAEPTAAVATPSPEPTATVGIPTAQPTSTATPTPVQPTSTATAPSAGPTATGTVLPVQATSAVNVSPSLSAAQQQFISSVAGPAQASARETGVPASVTIAQAILETAWGQSELATKGHNYFGIKSISGPGPAGVIAVDTWEVINGKITTVKANFRAYHDLAESVADHGHFLRDRPRYANAFKTTDPREFARRIQAGGYATDPAYAQKLIGLMDRFNLYRFDS